jgi:hypothetical protein
MKHEIREVDAERGIVQITSSDERWYARKIMEGTMWDYVPSVTWICGYYPKGKGFEIWLGNRTSYSEAEEIKMAAGDKGSKVHQAIGVLLSGGCVEMEDSFENPRTMELESLTADEYLCLMSFCEWYREYQPEVIAFEYTVWNEKYRYAGTVDLKCRIDGKVWIIDFKTSQDVWPSHELQVSAYKHCDGDSPKTQALGILQLGYRRNKNKKWKFTKIPDRFKLFMAAYKIWEHETADVAPLQREYPLRLSLNPGVAANA